MASTSLCTMAFPSLLLTVLLIPLPTSARPVAPFARQNASAPTDYYVIFDIAFSLAFFISLLGSFAWLTSRWTAGAQPAEFLNRLCAAFSRQLSVFGPSAFIERALATILDNNTDPPFVPRRGGASYPHATAPRLLQAGGPRWVGVIRGSSDHPASILSPTLSFE